MAGAYPKPVNERERRNVPQFDWKRLPQSGNKDIPEMPPGTWHEYTHAWWIKHWSHPCATVWLRNDPCHLRLMQFADILHREKIMHNGATLSEIRQLEDRLGLSPKSRLQLRWLIVPDDEADVGDRPAELAVVHTIGDDTSNRRADPRRS